MPEERLIHILMVEDNPAEARLIQELFKSCRTPHQLYRVVDGEEALNFLYQRDKHAGAPRPDLILLDLNLPKKDGREVLRQIKQDKILMRIPIIILSTSSADEDVCRSYAYHANVYVQKPRDLEEFRRLIRSIESFWLREVDYPRYKIP